MTSDSNYDSLIQILESRFVDVWKRSLLSGQKTSCVQAWLELSQHYRESHRLYHTLHHIDFCLREFDNAKFLINAPDTVEMAIWYHDIINTPQARDNEHQSQLLFERLAENNFDPQFVETVSKLIMITTHRQTPNTHDEQYICDIDLSSMGAPWEKFVSDSNDLRAESETSVEEYTIGKLKFFHALLERPRIFYSDYFYCRYESSARRNIQRYMSILNQDG